MTGDRLLYTAEAAELVGVTPATIRQWHHRGALRAFDYDRSRPLYLDADVYNAERATRTRPRVKITACPVPNFPSQIDGET